MAESQGREREPTKGNALLTLAAAPLPTAAAIPKEWVRLNELFGRFGASEGNPNPMQYFYSIGIGGKGMIPSRDLDRFGIGYFYTSVRNPTLERPPRGTTAFLRDEWSFEAFYNVAVTPWMFLTPDIQVIGPSQKRRLVNGDTIGTATIGTATVLGFRLQLLF